MAVRSVTAQLMQRDERPFGITEGEGRTYLVENARIVHPIAVSWSAVMSAYGNIYAHYLTCAVWEREGG